MPQLSGLWSQAYIKELELALYASDSSSALQRMHALSSEVMRLMFRRIGHQPLQRTALFASMTAQHHIPPNTKPSFSPELLVGVSLTSPNFNDKQCMYAAKA